MSKFRPNLKIFGVREEDPVWIYLVKHGDLLKIGKSTNPRKRINDAMTWLPDLEVIGIRPFWDVSFIERSLHTALCRNWYKGEWYKITDKDDYESFVGEFLEFYEEDRDMNSVDFIYWMNSSGMSEFKIEQYNQKLTLRKFQKQESDAQKKTDLSV